MKYEQLLILLPCHSLEDFPLYHEGDEAESLLAAWSALWHPALLHAAGAMPTWERADEPPEELANRLIVIPQVSESLVLAGWPARANKEGACVIRKKIRRGEMLAEALAELDGGAGDVDPDLAADFLALGSTYLQMELLTRQMRHYSNLDETHLGNEAVEAAHAAMSGDVEKARQGLQNCFDVLLEAREHSYPADAYLVDLTLVAESRAGASLREELTSEIPFNLLTSAELIEHIAEHEPETFEELKKALEEKRGDLVGGDYRERDLPMLPAESVLSGLLQGRAAYEKAIGQAPKIFGRRRYGLDSILPQLLSRLGYEGAAHFTLDDGHFPHGDQSRTLWEGNDNSSIDALTRVPYDATDSTTFLTFSEKMGESMDLDHVATVCFAHWPGEACDWYTDMRRMAAYAPVLGRFVTLSEYFEETDSPGQVLKFPADQYRAPYLKQAVRRRKANPLSSYRGHHHRRAKLDAAVDLAAVASLVQSQPPDEDLEHQHEVLAAEVERHTGPFDEPAADDLSQRLDKALQRSAEKLAAAIPRKDSGPTGGYFIFNPKSFARRVPVLLPKLSYLPAELPVRASQHVGDQTAVVVDLPAMGYVWIPKDGKGGEQKLKKPLAESETLRNEHFEIRIDPDTGGIRSLHDYVSRGNRMSQQIAFRLPGPKAKPGDVWKDPDLQAVYAKMTAESVEVTAGGPALGEITSRGTIVDPEGKELARFEQKTQVWRATRVISIDIKLESEHTPKSDPWTSYYAARIAWSDATVDCFRSTPGGTEPTSAKRLEAPYFVEARGEKQSLLLLTDGMPFHRSMGLRMLDCLLAVKGEESQAFRLGIGMDVDRPFQAGLGFVAPVPVAEDSGHAPAAGSSSWLFHLDRKNVVATRWSPLCEEGKVVGFSVRLMETEGRSGAVQLRCFKKPATARQVDLRGSMLVELPVADDAVTVELTPHEWAQVEVRW